MARSARFAGWAAIFGTLIGLAITPFMAAVWAYEPVVWDTGVAWYNGSLLNRTFGPTLESWGALTFGGGASLAADGSIVYAWTPYEVYGKVFFLVYLLMLPIVRYVHGLHRDSATPKWERRTWRVLWVALILAAVGDAVSYWGQSLPGQLGSSLWGGGFGAEILAMLVVLASTTVYGIVLIRLRRIPLWSSVLITLTFPIGIATLLAITDYLPNAIVVPMSMIWAAIGVWLLVRPERQRAIDPEPATPHI